MTLAQQVLDFESTVKRLVKAAKDPGFTAAG